MYMLLIPVILVFFVPESQAVKCYSCTGTSSCDDPFKSSSITSTCTGSICLKGKHTINGQLTVYLVLFTFIYTAYSLFLLTDMFISVLWLRRLCAGKYLGKNIAEMCSPCRIRSLRAACMLRL